MRAFLRYAMRRYKCKAEQVTFYSNNSIALLRDAVVDDLDFNTLGENHGTSIKVQRNLDEGTLVATLVHEMLHNWCYVRNRPMGQDAEHYCMDKLLREDERHVATKISRVSAL